MAGTTAIEWTGRTVNTFLVRRRPGLPRAGKLGWWCRKIDPACASCYAEALNTDPRATASEKRRGTGDRYMMSSALELDPVFAREPLERLLALRDDWLIFPNDMTDAFLSVARCDNPSCLEVWEDEDRRPGDPCRKCGEPAAGKYGVTEFWPSAWIQDLLDLYDALAARGHIVQSLTKRTRRLAVELREFERRRGRKLHAGVWIGFSAGNQAGFELRWPDAAAAARRIDGPLWLSWEPALGPIDLSEALRPPAGVIRPGLAWGVIGGESGRAARPFPVELVENATRQFGRAGVPLHVKQLGRLPVLPSAAPEFRRDWPAGTRFGNPTRDARLDDRVALLQHAKGGDENEWPEPYRVRQFPTAAAGFVDGRRPKAVAQGGLF